MQNNWETGSTFSKKMLGRSNSIRTKNSSGSHSRRNSVSQTSVNGPLHTPSDHILSWRNTVLDNNSVRNGGSRASQGDRSISPGKFNRASFQSQSATNPQTNLASAARQQPYMGTPLHTTSSVSTISPPPSIHQRDIANKKPSLPTPSFSFQAATEAANQENSLRADASSKNYQFWNPASWLNEAKSQLQNTHDPTKLGVESGARPLAERQQSAVSELSSEAGSPGYESEDEQLSCKKCGGTDFRTKKVIGRGTKQRLVCTKCGTIAE
jgi:hypothetical protein